MDINEPGLTHISAFNFHKASSLYRPNQFEIYQLNKKNMRTLTLNLAFLIFVGLGISSCSQGAKDVTSEIQKANEVFMKTFRSGDADAMAALYTPDGVLYPSNSEPLRGSENIKKFWEGVYESGLTDAQLETVSALAYGDIAIEEGNVNLYVGEQLVGVEKFIVVWHKENGKWKLHKDIFNSNLAKPNNVAIIQNIYDDFAKGDVPAVLSGLDEQVVWNEAENFPYADGNPYIGKDAVLNGVFARIGTEWEYWNLVDMNLHEMDNNMVLATGRYDAKNKKTGKKINAQFGHLWTLKDGKASSFQQFADTKQVVAALK